MAEPFDSAIFLDDVSEMAQEMYRPVFDEEMASLFGQTTNRIFKPGPKIIGGTGENIQVYTGRADSVRFSTNPLGAFSAAQRLAAAIYKVRFSQTGASDFVRISASCEASDIDVQNAGRGEIKDFVKVIYDSIMPTYEESLAIHRNIGRSAQIGSVSNTPKQNDAYTYAGATSGSVTNATGCRFIISSSSRAYFGKNKRVDIYNGTTLVAGNVMITDINRVDSSIGVKFNTSSTPTGEVSTGNLATVASGNTIFFAGEKDSGMYSIGAYMTEPTSSDSFIGGVNRTNSDYRWMIPTIYNAGTSASSVKITKSHFNTLGEAMGYNDESGTGGVFQMCPEIHNTLRDEIGEQSFIQYPIGDERMKRFAHFGSIGLVYQHPTFGVTQFVADPLCPSNQVRFLVPETWLTYYYAFKGLYKIPGDGGKHWYRMNESVPNTGRSIIWKADWYSLQTDICTKPWLNGLINYVSAA